MAMTTIFEQHQSGGTVAFLKTGSGVDGINLATLVDAVGNSQTVSITKLHWSTASANGLAISGGIGNFTLYGNGAWSQFNGWTPIDASSDIAITGDGTLFIEIKKLSGFTGRDDYSAAAI